MLLILRIVLAIYPHKCTKVAIFALPKKQPDMNILNNEGWNVVILENNFNSICLHLSLKVKNSRLILFCAFVGGEKK